MLKNLTVKSRLIFVIGFMSALLLGIGIFGLYGMSTANEGLRTVYEDRTIALGQLDVIVRKLTLNRLANANAIMTPTPESIQKFTSEIDNNIEIITKTWDAYMATTLTPEERILADKFAADRKVFVVEGLKPSVAALRANKIDEAKQIVETKMRPLFEPVRAGVDALIELQLNVAKAEYEQAVERYNTIRNIALVSITLGLLLSFWIGFMLIRAIMRPLALAQDVAGKIAAGDLTSNIEVDSNDELGKLLTSFKAMQGSIQTLIRDIKDSTDTINMAAKEIASGNSDLSQRTEEQASSLEETASSMEELTSTVRQNTENAKQANQLAIGASDVAGKGGAVVSQVVTTMDSINESSRKIVDIISVIDGIAFQTNILALNAAVEAARAGEQGRGFAVVASEVRNLAQRSAAAAKEIKTLIGDSVEKVEGGSKLVAEAGQTMEEILASIRRVTDIMSEITAASVEQSAGIEQVNLAITQMDEVTQQNAALVEEAAAAAESLEEQAQNLSASVSTFKVDDSANRTVARAPAPASRQVAAPARKAITGAKAGPGKSTAVAKPKPKSNDDGEWQEF
jgi:methyl-accepting chemotaxis protein-1 (serine sensor receptor)